MVIHLNWLYRSLNRIYLRKSFSKLKNKEFIGDLVFGNREQRDYYAKTVCYHSDDWSSLEG